MANPVERIGSAYKAWNDTKGGNRQPWLDLAGEDFEMHSVAPRPEGLQFTGDQIGPQKLDYYLRTLIEQWEMLYYRVDAIFGDDTRVVMFGECSYNFRANGENVTTPIANLWTFRDGKAVSCIEVFDSSEVIATASRPARARA